MVTGTSFQRVIPEPNEGKNYRKLIFCSGRVYYDLKKARADRGLDDEVGIARVEQISPFPYDAVHEEAKK